MDQTETVSAVAPLLRHRALRALLVAAPGLTAAVAIVAAAESNLALVIVLNAATGIIVSSGLFIAVSIVARRVANERIGLAQAAEQGFWRARMDHVSVKDESGLYTDWYFRLRLQEEIERSQRYDGHFSLLVIKPQRVHQEADMESAGDWFAERTQRHLRNSDLIARLQDGRLTVLMPNSRRRAATTAAGRLAKELVSVDPLVGIAAFPADGSDGAALIKTASETATARRRASAA